MLKFNISKEENVSRCEIGGTPFDLSVETIVVIREIYRGIKEQNEFSAKLYKKTIEELLETAFYSDEELANKSLKAEKESEKLAESLSNALQTLQDALNLRANNSEKRKKDIRDMDSEEFRKWLSEGDNE